MPTPATPEPQLPQEAAFRRAHPELAALATVQLREAQALHAAHRIEMRRQEDRVRSLQEWCSAHGIDPLPLPLVEPGLSSGGPE